MKKIAHIVSDEKFIDAAYHVFNFVDAIENSFFCLTSKTHLDFIEYANVEIVTSVSKKWIDLLNTYDLVIFHSLIEIEKKEVLIRLDKSTTILWIGWGADYYHLMGADFDNLYFKETEETLKGMKKYYQRRKIFELISSKFYENQLDKLKKLKVNKVDWLSRINYFSPVLKSEYDIINTNNPSFKADFLQWNYPIHLNEKIQNLYKKNTQCLLIGNSASYYNNHIDTLMLLSKVHLPFKKMIVPLNYGGESYYVKAVVKKGFEIFDDKFFPLVEFYNREKYYELIQSVSYAIFNSKRQIAMGNIYFLLSNGVKIFLSNLNPAYHFLLSKGYIIYSIEEMKEKNLSHPLSQAEIQRNFNLAHLFMGQKQLLDLTEGIIVSIFSDQYS